ncbi:MAG TPA: nitroreductase family protein [Bacillota bacterium]|jgi:nitroreductase|nr:nitroreductase family protein [Bacillota bacterium]HPZ11217.1 nitroreductase family protein [Bacillota bacterium]HQE09290.1 nitroreductase family protein [Bacillota bacterium]
MELYEALEGRRSIRKYTADPVPDETLQKLLNAARMAPSWKNSQCWRFIVVREQSRKQKLAASLPDVNPCKRAIAEAPVVLVLCADPQTSGRQDGKDYYLLDAGLAMQQLMLAAHAEGLGTCWVALFNEAAARPACNIPESYRIVALTPLGVPAHRPSPRPRKELGEIVFNEVWGNPLYK